ncbi:MAG TPA: class I SAM-dependent methyltransferase [Gemmatimonadaceae bacterium]
MTRFDDGSAGDANYGVISRDYTRFRQPDPRIAALLHAQLGDAQRVLNVGAGAGSYEPTGRDVAAVEPSASMRARRPPHLAPAIDAVAADLPFTDKSFDAAMTTFSAHQWPDLDTGLKEMRRVTRGPIVILTGDPETVDRMWLCEYAPEVIATEQRRYPPVSAFAATIGPVTKIDVPIPLDCVDGFNEAYYGRPEVLLDPHARSVCSAWSFLDAPAIARFQQRLSDDLGRGEWDQKYGALRSQPTYIGSLILIVSPS